jgi:outer membrane protein OmpA-like peptidoglycan-associated protein
MHPSTMKTHRLALALAFMAPAISASAQDMALRNAAACAPVGTTIPSDAPKVAVEYTEPRMTLAVGDRILVDAEDEGQLEVGQRYFIRRPMTFFRAPKASHTIGWMHITEVAGNAGIGIIDFSCDIVNPGDRLEPYADIDLPSGAERTNATGTPDFSQTARILNGRDGSEITGDRGFMLADIGADRGVAPGARFALFRAIDRRILPPPVGEAVVVSVYADKSLLRITEARDFIMTGYTLVARVGGTDLPPVRADVDRNSPEAAEPGRTGSGITTTTGTRANAAPSASDPVRTLTFEDVHFELDRATLTADAIKLLDEAAKTLQDNPTVQIRVEGHTCSTGGAAHNLALSEQRAATVRDYLVSRGVNAARLTTVGLGETQPKHDNTRPETRRLNRRATLAVTGQK